MKIILSGIKKTVGKLGYEIHRTESALWKTPLYSLYTYLRADGSFDYERYKQKQIEGNNHKADKVWVIEENIAFLSRYIDRFEGPTRRGLCHGTRKGMEQVWFKKYLNIDVIGTEISDTAYRIPDTLQWDFHEVKPEWIGAIDFIYSNSFDHSYDPEKCLNAWMRCLRKGGLCILEHSSGHEASAVNELDPFGADLVFMPYLVLNWGKGEYGVRELIEAPKKGKNVRYLFFIVIQKWM